MSLPLRWDRRLRGRAREAPPAPGDGSASAAQRSTVRRFTVWREVLGTGWLALAAALAATSAAAFHYGWKIPGAAPLVDERWASLVLVLASLLAGVLEGSHRAVARRERRLVEKREEIERLIRTPQRRLVEAKYHLYRDSFMCTQLVGFLMMSRMEASAITPETELGIERSWGSEFLERFRRMFGTGTFGDVVSQRIGGMFPPPRDQATAIYLGLADFLHYLAERITERDLDPEYLRGSDEARKPTPASAASGDAPPTEAAAAGEDGAGSERS